MRAVVQDRYGPLEVLRLGEVPAPDVGAGEVLVRVRAASVHPDVWHVLTGRPFIVRLMGAGLLRPKQPVPGTDVAGTVEAVGAGVTRFEPGEEVLGEVVRGHQWQNGGAYAELVAAREKALARKPATVTFEQAAAIPTSGLIALRTVRDEAGVRPGQRVLVNGAGGGVGTFAVQLARADGAEVTAVDHTDKLDLLRRIGAARVIDYTREDFTQQGERYDVIVDIPGTHPIAAIRRALTPDGTYVLIGHDRFGAGGGRWLGSGVPRFVRLLVASPFVSQRLTPRRAKPDRDPLLDLVELVEAGAVTPVVDRTFPLDEVRAAMRYLAEGRAVGKVVLTV